jgi:IS5 family transposase
MTWLDGWFWSTGKPGGTAVPLQKEVVFAREQLIAMKSRVNREVQARFRERLEVKVLRPTRLDEEARRKNTTKSRVRAKVEHPFRILKRIFGFDKVRYRAIAKNHHRLCANFALVNLYLHRKRLAALGQ